MKRWVGWMIVNILIKLYPAGIAGPGQIFPSDAYRRVVRVRRSRARNCIRYVDCTRILVDRGRGGSRRGRA